MSARRHPKQISASPSERVRVRRQPKKARYDRASIEGVLDRGLFCHLAFVDDGHPYCIPTLHARVGDDVYIHGSSASRTLRTLAAGAEACLTVTVLRGLVLARSAFEHSANYDSVVLLGRFHRVEDDDARIAALAAFTNKLLPGRWDEVRQPNRQELKATMVLAMSIDEASVKTRSGPPDDDDSPDAALDTWAGVVPVHTVFGEPEPSPGLRPGIATTPSVRRLKDARAWP
jgi:nitroimidazol reductase NimA-like FMN-containing flavoprotein (pyridoxamine 5'-phosphate oxidase superfamily)